MEDVLGYAGKRVVITGCASGMGEAAAGLLVDLGAEVIGLDVAPTTVPVQEALVGDLRDPSSIDAAVERIGGSVDAVFSVAGLPGEPFSDLDTMLVNFAGGRYFIEALVPSMTAGSAIVCVSSIAGLGWQDDFEHIAPLVTSDGFEAARSWCEANADVIAAALPYMFSKKVLTAWVAWRGVQLLEQGIRMNCIAPGPTTTGMMPAFEAQHGVELIDAFLGPSHRRSAAVEQAWPMLFLNSPRSSYVAGEALHTDAGFAAAVYTGQLDAQIPSDVAADL